MSSHSKPAITPGAYRLGRLVGALALVFGLSASLGSGAHAAVPPELDVQFTPSRWSPPGAPVTLTATIVNGDGADLVGETLDLFIFTGSQYKPSLSSAGGGYGCVFVNTGRYSTPHARCTGGVVPAGESVDIVYTIPTPAGPLYTRKLTYAATGTLSPSGARNADSIRISDFDGPDLVATGRVSPADVLVGDTISYAVDVTNTGFLPTDASTVRVAYPDGSSEDVALPGLAPGARASFAFTFVPAAPGTASATFTVDPDDLVVEASESNNQITLSATVSDALADLVVSQDQPATAAVGGTYAKTVTVSNAGGVGVTGVTLRDRFFIADSLAFTADHGFACVRTTYRVNNSAVRRPNGFECTGGSLAPGESATIAVVIRSPWYATTVTDNLSVDSSNTIVESDETNNTAVGSIVIR